MSQGSWRVACGLGALVLLWVIVYWWTPAPSRSIAFEAPREFEEAAAREATAREPQPPLEVEVATSSTRSSSSVPTDTPTRSGVEPPSFYMHTVVKGDSALSIAKKYYGSGDQWQAVMHANPKTDFQHLRAGMRVRVPVDPRNVQGRARPGQSEAKESTERAPRGPADGKTASGVTYQVVSGDTLTGLAHRFYGRAALWRIIVDANREALGEDGSRLRAGMTIVIPPTPAEP